MGVRRDCMRAQIGRELIRRIVEGEYAPGDRLVELRIAREFDTSQGPVREALRELEALRLVETEPYKGTRVRAISLQEQREAAAVRGVLEEAAAKRAAGVLRGDTQALQEEVAAIKSAAIQGDLDGYARRNNTFHRKIVEAAGNAVMLRLWDTLQLEARTRIGLGTFRHDLQVAADSHWPIVEALEAGDGERAGTLLREHAERFGGGDAP
ncbi:MAG: GntR family transcriptional regulator [Isosphaeraceae bacterium]